MKLLIHTDGGARGNPGPAAVGVVVESVEGPAFTVNGNKTSTVSFGKKIGETTNNVAEYMAVVEALRYVNEWLTKADPPNPLRVEFFLDSTLVVNQLNGLFKVKEARLRELLTMVRTLEGELGAAVSYTVIRREQNSRADFLVNQALDNII